MLLPIFLGLDFKKKHSRSFSLTESLLTQFHPGIYYFSLNSFGHHKLTCNSKK